MGKKKKLFAHWVAYFDFFFYIHAISNGAIDDFRWLLLSGKDKVQLGYFGGGWAAVISDH